MEEKSVNNRVIWCYLFAGNALNFLIIQGLLFWIGSKFPSVENLNLYLDIGLSALIGLTSLGIIFWYRRNTFAKMAFPFTLGAAGIYICLTLFCSWWLISLSLAFILSGILVGKKLKFSSYVIYGIIGMYLLYISCTWILMTLTGLSPAASNEQCWGLCLLTLFAWFRPMLNE